jgi:hypothetical protein
MPLTGPADSSIWWTSPMTRSIARGMASFDGVQEQASWTSSEKYPDDEELSRSVITPRDYIGWLRSERARYRATYGV